jgi:hypothetical protein
VIAFWRRAVQLLSALLLVSLAIPVTSSLSSTKPKPACNPCVGGGGNKGTIDVIVRRGVSDRVPGRGDATQGEAPGRTEWRTVEERMSPACSGNGTDGADHLCASAVSSCPADDQTRYWIWHRVTEHRLGPPRTSSAGAWVQEPGTYCLGPDDPGVPDIGRVLTLVQTEFQSLPLRRHDLVINPSPRTLVNIPTRFGAGSAEPQTFAPVLLGFQVDITAMPTTWEWDFGDGTRTTSSVPTTEHVYRRATTVGASVRVTWSGTFTLGRSPEVFTIRAPAYVESAPVRVDVRTARTELVAE